ncbi:MAG: Fic family protein [Chlamydiota bacterium]
MDRVVIESEQESVINILTSFPEGASLQEINQKLLEALPVYTLQRRLAFLIKQGRVQKVGSGRASRYKLGFEESGSQELVFLEQEEKTIPLSKEGLQILRKVSAPIQSRTPVGYNRRFLDAYRPNHTKYLPEDVQERLLTLGKTDGDQPAGTYARAIFSRLLIDLSWNSSRLEGNTYSLLETERLLELSEIAEGKSLVETQMILNHKAAIEFLVECAAEVDLNRQTVLNVHALLSENLLKDSRSCGSIRSKIIGIGQSVYQPLAIPDVINECFRQILDTAKAIKNPLEQALFLMIHLPYLQPFEDVNKRVSRLVANIPLIRCNLAPLSFMDVPQKLYVNGLLAVYELNNIALFRDVFIWAYERSCAVYSVTCQTLGEPDPFRLRYRNDIFEMVSRVVKERMDKKSAIVSIKETATQKIPPKDQLKFIETVEKELRSLHEGNIARYKLRPSEYIAWSDSCILR